MLTIKTTVNENAPCRYTAHSPADFRDALNRITETFLTADAISSIHVTIRACSPEYLTQHADDPINPRGDW